MATDQERLIVSLEARVRDFEKNFQKANRTANDNFSKIERRAKQSGDRLESTMTKAASRASTALKGFGAGIFAGLAAGGVAGIVNQIGQVAQGIAQIGDEAKRAGVSSRVFQEWATVANQARIPVDAMIDGLKELQLRGDEFATTGKGSAAEAFARLGYGAEELQRKLADPSALLLEIIDRLGKFDKAAQIRIADELFGGSAGERFVELIDQGAAGVRRTIDEAHALGNVLSDEVIERAAEIDRQFKIVSQTVGTALKGAIVDAASGLIAFIEMFRDFENQRNSTLDLELRNIGKERLALENEILRIKGEQTGLSSVAQDLGFGEGSAAVQAEIAGLEAQSQALAAQEREIIAVLEARRQLKADTGGTSFTPAPYTPPPPGGGTKRDAEAAKIERERQAVASLIAELEREMSLIGATDLQREISNALRQAGAAATDDQRAKITALITALHAEEAAQQKATDAKQEFANMAGGAITGFISDLRSGATAGQAFGNMISRIADQLVDMAVQLAIIKPLMGAFGLSGGGMVSADPWQGLRLAGGGHVRGPGTATSDSIPARLSDGEFVVNADATRRHRALLEAVNSGRVPAFANGGGADGRTITRASIGGVKNTYAPNISVQVAGSSGDSTRDEQYAGLIAEAIDKAFEAKAAEWSMDQMRPGGQFTRQRMTA